MIRLHFISRCHLAIIISGLANAFSRQAAAQAIPPNEANSITLLSLNQPPCAVLDARSVLKAKIAYHINASEVSTQGFAVSIKFKANRPGMTFSEGTADKVRVTSRQDTVTITYPMASIRRNGLLEQPLTCFFYLHRYTAPGRSTVIAQTKPIVFKECQ